MAERYAGLNLQDELAVTTQILTTGGYVAGLVVEETAGTFPVTIELRDGTADTAPLIMSLEVLAGKSGQVYLPIPVRFGKLRGVKVGTGTVKYRAAIY